VDFSCIYPTLCALTGLPLPPHLDGRDITALLKEPSAAWAFPALTTYGFKNHAVRDENWRYIHYANGDEELYHDAEDPLEYVNLAGRPEFAARKAELAAFLPKSDAPDLPINRAGKKKSKKDRNKDLGEK